jgi:uncharacterized protein involved in exopolysaccharide biosynthesis
VISIPAGRDPESSPVPSGVGNSASISIEPEQEVSPLKILNFLLRNLRYIVVIPAIVALLVGILNFTFAHREWSAKAVFMPQSVSRDGGASIAAEFGVDIGSQDKQNSPQFYVSLLKSRELIASAAMNKYSFRAGSDSMSGNLIQLYEIENKTEALKREDAISMLTDDVTAETDVRTGLVGLTVKARWAPLAKAINDKLIADVNDFNLRIRQSKARAEKEFVETQVADARGELRQSEDQLQYFLLKNREYSNDPRLAAEHDRISRELTMRSMRYGSLTGKLDQAAIEAVRATPVITVLQKAEVPVKPQSRGTVTRAMFAFAASALIGLLYSLFSSYGREKREGGGEDYYQFQHLVRDIRGRLRNFGRKPREA